MSEWLTEAPIGLRRGGWHLERFREVAGLLLTVAVSADEGRDDGGFAIGGDWQEFAAAADIPAQRSREMLGVGHVEDTRSVKHVVVFFVDRIGHIDRTLVGSSFDKAAFFIRQVLFASDLEVGVGDHATACEAERFVD